MHFGVSMTALPMQLVLIPSDHSIVHVTLVTVEMVLHVKTLMNAMKQMELVKFTIVMRMLLVLILLVLGNVLVILDSKVMALLVSVPISMNVMN